jgi:chromosome segregation ATPase
MWPKLFAQLFELLPHAARLIPVADRYFSSKAANEKANEAALAAMAEGVRGDLGQVTKAHAGLYRQLQEVSAQIAEVSEDAKRTRLSIEQQGHRLENLESEVVWLGRWVKGGMVLVVVLLGVVLYLVTHPHY